LKRQEKKQEKKMKRKQKKKEKENNKKVLVEVVEDKMIVRDHIVVLNIIYLKMKLLV
jgi:hypothetical protein